MADLSGHVQRRARLSADGKYRYLLSRTLDAARTATFIMLNPSTADAEVDDPTVRKCLGFCRLWGCGTLQVVNLFGIRATSPRDLMRADDPVGPENKRAVEVAMDQHRAAGECRHGPLVCAWGAHGGFLGQDLEMMGWLDGSPGLKPMCLGVTKDGYPRHPLYIPYSTRLIRYIGRII
jgi:hypothetical protein